MATTKADLMSAIRTKLAAAGRPSTHFNLSQTDLDAVCDGIVTYLNANYATGSGLSDGDKGDITVSASGATWTIDNNVVSLAKIADIATARILGRNTAGSGDPEELTGTTVTAMLDAVTAGAKGLAPASGGGTANFLRADATWVAPDANYATHMFPPIFNGMGSFTMTNATCYCLYLGRTMKALTSVTAKWNISSTGSGGITYAEIGVCSGTYNYATDMALTLLGYTDISGDLGSTGAKSTVITATIPAGTEVWSVISVNRATSAPAIYTSSSFSVSMGSHGSKAATRPSTMASPTTFTHASSHAPLITLQTF